MIYLCVHMLIALIIFQVLRSLTSSRVHHAIEYGADPTGKLDSSDALEQAISDAFQSPVEGHLMQGVANLGGAQLHLDGGTYKISRPLRLPKTSGGNFMVLPISITIFIHFIDKT